MRAERVNAVKTSFFGKGSISLLPDELKKRGYRRALIVTDKFLYETKVAERVGNVILQADMEYAIYYQVTPNPTTAVTNECIEAAKALAVDLLVAVGGGSAIDTCKAVSIVLANGGRIEEYEGVNKSKKRGIPIVAVNTTAGTGSEVTSFYIITDTVRHSKMCMVDTNCMVDIAINDVDFMVSMPKGLTASTGMDAMTHAIEAALTWKATPLTDKDAYWAIDVIRQYLPRAVADGNDIEAREMMAYAENVAGMAFSNSGLGMVHAMAHALGGFYNLAHGVCNAVLLPYVLEFLGKSEVTHPRFMRIAKTLALTPASGPEAVKMVVAYVRELSSGVGIPANLTELKKVQQKDFPSLAKLALADTCMEASPVQPSAQEVIQVYKNALG
jgi:alcohol dehydrogenase